VPSRGSLRLKLMGSRPSLSQDASDRPSTRASLDKAIQRIASARLIRNGLRSAERRLQETREVASVLAASSKRALQYPKSALIAQGAGNLIIRSWRRPSGTKPHASHL
jgi:hypothetical protein